MIKLKYKPTFIERFKVLFCESITINVAVDIDCPDGADRIYIDSIGEVKKDG